MKKQNNVFKTMSKTEMDLLTAEVKEVLAKDFIATEKVFSVADLWHIQRSKKRNPGRRFLV